MKDLGESKKVLNMEIKRDRNSDKVCLMHFQKGLQKFNMNGETKLVSTSLAPHFKLKAAMSLKSVKEREYMSHILYASALDNLMYAMVCIRPDLSQAVSMVSRHIYDSDRGH